MKISDDEKAVAQGCNEFATDPGRQQVMVPTMQQQRRLRYGDSDDVQVLELPYVGYEGLSMLIILPKKIDGLSDLEKALTGKNLRNWSAGLNSQLVKVHLQSSR